MEPSPSVTIAIPTFNRPSQLAAALRSASAQDYQNLKIVVSDNASDADGITEIVSRLARHDGRISYFRQASNIGAQANFIWLLNHADTEYFMWFGDDDEMKHSNHVTRLVDTFDMHPMADVAFPDCDVASARRVTHSVLHDHFINCETDNDYLRAWCKFGGGQPFYGLFRTDHLRSLDPAGTLRESWRYYNEGIFLHRMFLAGAVRFCPGATLVYNGDNSGTRVRSRNMLASFMRYTIETHQLYLSCGKTRAEKFKLLRIIAASHYPYIRHLARKSIFNGIGG